MASFIDDPVRDGVAESLSHPGGSVTGIAMLASEGDTKRLQILHEAIPPAHRFGFLVPGARDSEIEKMKQTALGLDVELIAFEANSASDYPAAFDAMQEARVEGVIIASSPLFFQQGAQLAALADARKLPTICEWREMAGAGCVIGYGPDLDELRRRTTDFVARLFAGKASKMPFEQPGHFEMGINGKTARRIALALPPSLLARADEVIE